MKCWNKNIDKYAYHPKQLHSMCLTDFVAKTDIVQKYTPIQSDDEQSINENRKNDDIRDLFPIQLSFDKTLKL